MRRSKLDEAIDIVKSIANEAISQIEESIMDLDSIPEKEREEFYNNIQKDLDYWEDIKDNLKSKLSLYYSNIIEVPEDPEVVKLKKQLKDQIEENKLLRLELNETKEKLENLSIKNMSLQAKISYRDDLLTIKPGQSVLKYNAQDWYPGECNDFLLSILSQIKDRFAQNSRAYEIINKLLESNNPVNEGDEILEILTRLFTSNSNQVISDSIKKELEKYNFEFPPCNGHQKVIPFGDPSKMLIVSGSPSDRRGVDNSLSRVKDLIASKNKV